MLARTSLQNRIFVATTLVAVLSLGFALHFVDARIEREGEADLLRGLTFATELSEKHHAGRLDTLTLVARLIADLPKLKAAVETGHPPTIQPLARDYLAQARADALVVTGDRGELLAAVGTSGVEVDGVAQALQGETVVSTRYEGGRLLELVTVPVGIGGTTEVLGTLGLGLAFDDELAAEIEAVTSSEVALIYEGRVLASTVELPAGPLMAAAGLGKPTVVGSGDSQYVVLGRPVSARSETGPTVALLRSPSEHRRFLRATRLGLAGAAIVAIALAVILSYAVARSVTRPLSSIAATMREMTASGDLTREVPDGGGWDDEDARVLATAFRSLTDALRRFQREAAQKERLSALGQLSTVVAHEVRNPLMIIKASLRALSRPGVTEAERADAAADIDQEVGRLDRIVREILEYARPVSVAMAPADLAAVCHDAAQAVGDEGAPVHVEADRGVGTVHTDAERLRRALVNLLTNARDAVAGRGEAGAAAPSPIALRLSRQRTSSGDHVVIEVADRGVGIAAEDLGRVFDPYFTTKRTGTWLGLAITRNIVESLGGTIAAESRVGEGTTIRIELPAT